MFTLILASQAGRLRLAAIEGPGAPVPVTQVPRPAGSPPPATASPEAPAAPAESLARTPGAALGPVPLAEGPLFAPAALRFPFEAGDHLAMVSATLGKGTAQVEAAAPEELRVRAQVKEYSNLVKMGAGMMGMNLKDGLEVPLSITRDAQGRYTLATQVGDRQASWEGLQARAAGNDQELIDDSGQRVALLRQTGPNQLSIDIPLARLLASQGLQTDMVGALLPKQLDLQLTRVGTKQDKPADIQKKTQQAFKAADQPDRLTAGVAFGGEPIVTATLGYEHTLSRFADLARLQAGGKLFLGTHNMIGGTIGGEVSLAPWQQPFFVGANLGVYTGNFGPNHSFNFGVGPEFKLGYEKGPWEASVSYTHIFGTTGINLVGIGGGYRF